MTMDWIASFIGYGVMAIVAIVLLLVVLVLVWRYFPAKIAFRRGPSLIGRLVINDQLAGQNLNLLAGIQSRRKPRWFFGLMLLDNTGQQPRWPRITTKADV